MAQLHRLEGQLDAAEPLYEKALALAREALKARVDQGDSIQPAWGQFVDRLTQRYGLPAGPRVRHLKMAGPLATMVLAYRR